jgi:4'-phosphopantetheinyl transferase EntD
MQPGPRLPAPLFADLATVAIECVDVADRLDLLFDAERALVRDAAAKRQSEFASGRHAAHRLMDRLGVGRAPILRAERAPVWPQGWVGSISHTESLALAALAARREVEALGIDIERRGRITRALLRMILTPAEIARCGDGADLEAALVAFSAKEALYKAVQVHAGGYIGFHDVEIDIADGVFTARAVGPRAPADIVARGLGRYEQRAEFVATLFWVPAAHTADG